MSQRKELSQENVKLHIPRYFYKIFYLLFSKKQVNILSTYEIYKHANIKFTFGKVNKTLIVHTSNNKLKHQFALNQHLYTIYRYFLAIEYKISVIIHLFQNVYHSL